MTSRDPLSNAAAEVKLKEIYPDKNPNDLLFDCSLYGVPLNENPKKQSEDFSKIVETLNNFQLEFRQSMELLTNVLIQVSSRLSAVECKVDMLMDKK